MQKCFVGAKTREPRRTFTHRAPGAVVSRKGSANDRCAPAAVDSTRYQEFPRAGRLAANLDSTLAELRDKLADKRGQVYCQVVTSAGLLPNGLLYQSGSGPNFQGGFVTLCSFRWRERSYLTPHAWEEDMWMAFFTSRSKQSGSDQHYLLCLMKVEKAYASQRDLWKALPSATLEAKAADKHRRGDVYRPRDGTADASSHLAYFEPMLDHNHHRDQADTSWFRDVNDRTGSQRAYPNAAFLVGDRDFSFLWQQPLMSMKFNNPRSTPRLSLFPMLDKLQVRG